MVRPALLLLATLTATALALNDTVPCSASQPAMVPEALAGFQTCTVGAGFDECLLQGRDPDWRNNSSQDPYSPRYIAAGDAAAAAKCERVVSSESECVSGDLLLLVVGVSRPSFSSFSPPPALCSLTDPSRRHGRLDGKFQRRPLASRSGAFTAGVEARPSRAPGPRSSVATAWVKAPPGLPLTHTRAGLSRARL